MNDQRRAELAESLERVRARIAAACRAAGREPSEVTLVVVTKYFPAEDVRALHGLGVRHVAENKHQEAVAKRADCADLDLTWHYVGHLQSNKAASVAAWADVVQSVDRERLLSGLSRGAQQRGRPVQVLVQVSLDEPGARGERSGVDPASVGALADRVAAEQGLVLRGVMGVAPRGGDAATAFGLLEEVAAQVRVSHPQADWVSAGMSGDLEEAVLSGATHVRVGTAVLGNRPGR